MRDDLAAYLYELATAGASEEARTRLAVLDAAHAIEAGAPVNSVVCRLVMSQLCDPWAKRIHEVFRDLIQSPGRGSARSPDLSVTAGPAAEPSSASTSRGA